jgi:hypothetical protein
MTKASILMVALLLACSPGQEGPGDPAGTTILSWVGSSGTESRLLLDGAEIGRLRRNGERWTLSAGPVSATLDRRAVPLDAESPYPRRLVAEGRLGDDGPVIREAFTLLAPPAPLSIEGLGLEVSTDTPGLNREEHAELRAWLGAQGLPADTTAFQALHQADSGRELRVWYEISGRRVRGALLRGGGGPWLARFDSLYRSEEGRLKIHHKRPGENGRFTYHRQSLELADSVESATGGLPALESHQCGCYGYAIAADFMTIGDSLYHVEADWLDDRVGADFFIGLERRDGFPWIGLGDRRRMRDLARRVKAYRLTDARGELFAEIALDLPLAPPSSGLGSVSYRVDISRSDGVRASLARIDHRDAGIEVHFFDARRSWVESLERLDTLLAAMPTQIMRGDGIRDSHLAEIEQLIDWARLIREPAVDRLADAVSDIDALTAPRKVQALLGSDAERFFAEANARPPGLMPGLTEESSEHTAVRRAWDGRSEHDRQPPR